MVCSKSEGISSRFDLTPYSKHPEKGAEQMLTQKIPHLVHDFV